MSQITLRSLPKNLEQQVRRMARENQTSLNKMIITLLEKSLGLRGNQQKQRNLSDLSGIWGPDEAEAFKKNTKQFDTIDMEIWE